MKLAKKIGLGSVQFGTHYGISNKTGQTKVTEVKKILELARQRGIEIIDTASGYGEAESILGQAGVKTLQVVSKFLPRSTHGAIADQFQKSLNNLKLQNLYGYLAHRPIECITQAGTWDELQRLKSGGLIQKIGFSFNKPEEIDACLDNGMFPDLVQVPYNYLDTRFKEHLVELHKKGCEIHTRSAFLQGLFFMDPTCLDSFFSPVKEYLQALQDTYRDLLPHYLLEYVCRQDFIDHVIIGIENAEQLSDNLEFLELKDSLPPFNLEIPESVLMPMNWPK
jgi:aryl-alcohol dehydrogenase-like predicted oxidoreductase